MLNTISLKLIGIAGVAVLAVAGWFYVQNLRSSLELEKANRAILEEAVKSAKQSVNSLKSDVAAIGSAVTTLTEEFAEARKDVKALDKKFTTTKTGEKRDLDNLAARHPKLIENAINKGTKEAFRCNELATGVKPEPGEKNSVCPGLLK